MKPFTPPTCVIERNQRGARTLVHDISSSSTTFNLSVDSLSFNATLPHFPKTGAGRSWMRIGRESAIDLIVQTDFSFTVDSAWR